MDMQLELGTLYEDDENEYMVWKWRAGLGLARHTRRPA